jgi:CRISPR-associated protein Cmr6
MPNGILKLSKTAKGKIIVALDRLNGKPPMPLSSVSLADLTHNEKECEFGFDKGMVTFIKIDGVQIYPSVMAQPKPIQQGAYQQQQQNRPQTAPKTVEDSFKPTETFLPKDVQRLPISDIDNFNLKFNKAARYTDERKSGKFYFFKNDYRRNREGLESGYKFMIKPNYGNLNFQQISKRLENQAKTLPQCQKLEFSPDWRLILGIGSSSVYEVGMTLHHVYGIPYIPASSIKGLVRSWIIQNCFGVESESELESGSEATAFQESKLLCDIFGCAEKYEYETWVDKNGIEVTEDFIDKDDNDKPMKPKKKKASKDSFYKINSKKTDVNISEKQGDVIFFDAFPMSAPNVEPDIMNVHYPDYYNDKQGKIAPTDFQSPNPVSFLTVGNKDLSGNDLKFVTYIGVRENKMISELDANYNNLLSKDMSILEFVSVWLKKALTEHGIGAKTAVGYGYMNS